MPSSKAKGQNSTFKTLEIIIVHFFRKQAFFMNNLEKVPMDWWVEIITKAPDCKYYFGPFGSHREAQLSQLGYIEDLERERPQLIAIEIKQCQPEELTIFKDEPIESMESISQNMSA
jgi:hypothetical protein